VAARPPRTCPSVMAPTTPRRLSRSTTSSSSRPTLSSARRARRLSLTPIPTRPWPSPPPCSPWSSPFSSSRSSETGRTYYVAVLEPMKICCPNVCTLCSFFFFFFFFLFQNILTRSQTKKVGRKKAGLGGCSIS